MKTIGLSMALVLAGLGGNAFAQSSAQLFGTVDLSLSHYKVNGGVSKTALSPDGNTTNRLGFRGKEDLGGGLSALYWLEGGFDPSDPSTSFTFTRRSVIGLSSASVGTLYLGRDYTPTFNLTGAFGNPWNTQGVGESLIYRGRLTTHTTTIGNQSTVVRASNALNYFTPAGLGGFYGQFMYGMDEATEGKAGRYIDGRIGYKKGPIHVSAAYGKVAGGVSAPTSAPRDVNNGTLGVGYDFGVANVSLMVAKDKVAMPLGDYKLDGYSLGVTVPMSFGQLRAAYDRVKFDYPTTSAGADKLAVGYVYDLSKRTALYGTAAYVRNRNKAYFVSGGSITGKSNASSSGIDIGVRHNFRRELSTARDGGSSNPRPGAWCSVVG